MERFKYRVNHKAAVFVFKGVELELAGDARRPKLVVFDHRVEDGQQFSHAGGEDDFVGFTCLVQPLGEVMNSRVIPLGDKGGHVQGRAQRAAPPGIRRWPRNLPLS